VTYYYNNKVLSEDRISSKIRVAENQERKEKEGGGVHKWGTDVLGSRKGTGERAGAGLIRGMCAHWAEGVLININ